jgi:hypothetical protein
MADQTTQPPVMAAGKPRPDQATRNRKLIRATADILTELVEEVCDESWQKRVAITRLEEALMWASSAVRST